MVEFSYKYITFQHFFFISAGGGKFALSGGKSRLSGGWADHSRPVWAEHCNINFVVLIYILIIILLILYIACGGHGASATFRVTVHPSW